MDKIEHPIKQPPIISYLHHAYALAIIMNYPQFSPWFYSNYIQLYYCENSMIKFNFYSPFDIFWNTPCLIKEVMSKKIAMGTGVDIKQLINTYIKEGFYVCTFLDEFYVPDKAAYKVYHFIHECLIYGYDNVNRRYNILGFDRKMTFRGSYLTYEDFDTAFTGTPEDKPLIFTRADLQHNPGFDVGLVKSLLQDYRTSANTSRSLKIIGRERKNFVWGIQVFECAKAYLEQVLNEGLAPDYRYFCIFQEHKKCMLERIGYMLKHGYIQNSSHYELYQDINIKFLILRNMLLKYTLTGKKNIIVRMLDSIDKTVSLEKEILENLIQELEHFPE